MGYFLMILCAGIAMTFFVYNGMLTSTGKLFSRTPAVTETENGPSAREQSSDQAREIYERNQRQMDDLRDKLERRRNNQ